MSFSVIVLSGLVLAYLIISLARAEWRFALWVAVILAIVVPWAGWHAHGHWDAVNWVPFSAVIVAVRPSDVVGNFIMYVPFGYLLVRNHLIGRSGIARATVAAVCLSLATEWTQVYGLGRFPSTTDVVMNGLGALAGAVVARRGRGAASR